MPVKSKRLTNKEKALKAKTKKELQKQGLLPPDKPRLNRKKFATEKSLLRKQPNNLTKKSISWIRWTCFGFIMPSH